MEKEILTGEMPALRPNQKEFLGRVCGPALESERSSGVPASVTIAQAILESGWGKSKLFLLGNNPFGIKASHRQGVSPYSEFDWPTHEYVSGHVELIRAGFMKFPSLEEAFAAHAHLFWRWQRYAAAIAARSDWRRFAEALGPRTGENDLIHGGYSTNPHYAEEITALVEEFHLDDHATLEAYARGAAELETARATAPLPPGGVDL